MLWIIFRKTTIGIIFYVFFRSVIGVDPWSRWSGPYIVFLLIEENYLAIYFLPSRKLGKQKIKDRLIDLDILSYYKKGKRHQQHTYSCISVQHYALYSIAKEFFGK